MSGSIASPEYAVLQYLTAVVLIICLLGQICWMVKKETVYLWELPMMLVVLHALAFYITVFLRNFGYIEILQTNALTNWSAVLRLHEYSTITIIVLERLYSIKKQIEKRKKDRSSQTINLNVRFDPDDEKE